MGQCLFANKCRHTYRAHIIAQLRIQGQGLQFEDSGWFQFLALGDYYIRKTWCHGSNLDYESSAWSKQPCFYSQ